MPPALPQPPRIHGPCDHPLGHTPPPGTPPFVSPEFRTLFCDECGEWTEHRRAVDYDRAEKAYACGDCGNQIIYFINYQGIEL